MPPRLKRVMMYQFVAVILNAFLAVAFSFMLIDWAAPWLLAESQAGNMIATILRWMSVLGFTFIGSKWLNNISMSIINMIVYGGNLEEAAQEATDAVEGPKLPEDRTQTQTTEAMNFLIVDKPEAPYARYQDADIFEWLDVKDEQGTVRRMLFEGTIDMKKGLPSSLEVGTILLPPGILYKLSPAQ